MNRGKMNKYLISVLLLTLPSTMVAKDNIQTIDPNEIHLNSHVHKKLSPELLKRIRATIDVFEIVDGMSYEKVVDLYKRDLDPESNLVIWEEMARVYKIFCKSRCTNHAERMDVYRALLLRSMYTDSNALKNLKINVITRNEAKNIISQYRLKAKPIDVIKK
jgi:hypothetical protein